MKSLWNEADAAAAIARHGAMGIPLALMRQYALEHGGDGVGVNAINPDRIRSGLLTDGMIAARSAARGTDPAT